MLCHWNEIGISTNRLKDYCCWSVSNSSHQPRTCQWPQEIFGRSRVFHCSETSIFWISSGKLSDHACNLLVMLFNMSSLPELNGSCFGTHLIMCGSPSSKTPSILQRVHSSRMCQFNLLRQTLWVIMHVMYKFHDVCVWSLVKHPPLNVIFPDVSGTFLPFHTFHPNKWGNGHT